MGTGAESGLHLAENAVAVSGPGSLAAAPRAAQDITVTGGGSVVLEEGFDGTVRMEVPEIFSWTVSMSATAATRKSITA